MGDKAITEQELAAIEAHAQAVDSRMSENCLRLIVALREARQDFLDCNEDRVRACEFERLFEAERDDALQHLAEWGHKIAGAAGMVPDRLVVADATAYWWKRVQPFLKRLGWFDRPASEGGESLNA